MFRALENVKGEVIVVDNNSKDGSQQMLKEKFGTQITLIENKDNPGFSRANNQGIHIAKGKYVLLLNPDTIVEEQTFRKCIDFMDKHGDGGGLGVKMIDGNGAFLPESKRALPTPWVSFYKIFGLSWLFPKSKTFGKYHLTYLNKEKNHEIEILSGAFMFMRKELLDKVGYLDETFFMYGEDIDLSYRILLAGYKNYYFSDTQIVHYKGESTKKGSLNYVRVFYQAMIIFAKKHFGGSQKQLFILAIRLAVYFRALIAIFHRLGKRFGFPFVEGIMIFMTIFGVKEYWEHYVKYIENGSYPAAFTYLYMPIYTLVFVGFLWIAGAYKKPYQLRPLIVAPLSAFIGIATVTYMFTSVLNFSRAIVGLSSVFTMILAIANRGLIHRWKKGNFFFMEHTLKRVILMGSAKGISHALKLIQGELDYPVELVGIVSDDSDEEWESTKLGNVGQLEKITQLCQVEEVLISSAGFSLSNILKTIERMNGRSISVKLIPPKASFIIGPQEIFTSRYVPSYQIGKHQARKTKRVIDIIGSLGLLLSFPFLFWAYKKPLNGMNIIFRVLMGKMHLVGYIQNSPSHLPALKSSALNILCRLQNPFSCSELNVERLDQFYARHWRWELDLEILWKGWRWMGTNI